MLIEQFLKQWWLDLPQNSQTEAISWRAVHPPTKSTMRKEQELSPEFLVLYLSVCIDPLSLSVFVSYFFLVIGEFDCLHWAVEGLDSVGLHFLDVLNPFFQALWMNMPEGSLTLTRRNNLILIFMWANPTPFSLLNFFFEPMKWFRRLFLLWGSTRSIIIKTFPLELH